MKSFYQYIADNKEETHGILVFGRFNPPTIGHAKVIKKVNELAKQYGAPHHIVLSHSHDKKNPLTVEQKVKYTKMYFPESNIEIASEQYPGIIQQAERLNDQYTHLHVIAGEDRIQEFETLLHKYNGKSYHYESITVHSAGERDTSKSGIIGMSASKMKQFAYDCNYEGFRKGIPKYISELDKRALYDDVRRGLLISEMDQGYPITPDGGPGDNPDPVKEKEVHWPKNKKKIKKWNGFKTSLKGPNIGKDAGIGIGPTYDTRYNGTASAGGGIGDPSFRESIDSPAEIAFLPAFGITGSTNKDPLMTMQQKTNQNNSPSKTNNKQKWRNFRRSLGVPIG